MIPFGIDVQFGGDRGVLEGEEVDGGVFDMYRIILGVDDEGGRGFVSDMDIRVGGEVLLSDGEVAGIDDPGEVRAAAELIRRIGHPVGWRLGPSS